MSAANRSKSAGTGHERAYNDFYGTSDWITKAILPCLKKPIYKPVVFDPCAGDGAIYKAVSEVWTDSKFVGVEIDSCRKSFSNPDYNTILGDYLKIDDLSQLAYKPDILITNPPYSLAQEFIEKSLKLLPDAEIAMLLRLNFLGSKKRKEFNKDYPCNIYVSPRRPGFTNNGKTDATEYAWFVYNQDTTNKYYILDT